MAFDGIGQEVWAQGEPDGVGLQPKHHLISCRHNGYSTCRYSLQLLVFGVFCITIDNL